MSGGSGWFPSAIEQEQVMQVMSHVEKINPLLQGFRVRLDEGELHFVLAEGRADAIRMVREQWAAEMGTDWWNAPECEWIKRSD